MDVELVISIICGFFPVVIDTFKENSVWYQARAETTRRQAVNVVNETEHNKAKIPAEYMREAPSYLIIHALHACVPFLDESSIRQTFAKLLAAAYDSRKISEIHPGFIQMITELSPNDVRVLSYLNNHKESFIGLVAIKDNVTEYPLIDSENLIQDIGIEGLALSLNNLKRLNILTIDSNLLLDKYLFTHRLDEPLERVSDKIKNEITNAGYQLNANEIYITSLGLSFLKVCID